MKRCHQTCMMFLRSFALALVAILTSSCAVLDALDAMPIPTLATEIPTLTPTIVWFPPSVTPTLGAAATPKPPTPEMRPGLGSTILTDDFSNPRLWDIATSDQGSAEVNDNRLILSAQSKVYKLSLRTASSFAPMRWRITASR